MTTEAESLLKQEDKEMIKKVAHSIGIAEAMGESFWLSDRNHRTIYVNPIFEKTTGYKASECIGKPADFYFDEESKEKIKKHRALREKGVGSKFEANIVTKSGSKIPVLISGAPTSEGGDLGIFMDLTKEKKLRNINRLAEQIIKNSSEAIVVLNHNRKIEMWNSGAEKIFGYNEEEILGKHINTLIPKEEVHSNITLNEEIERKNFVSNFETTRMGKNGKQVAVSISASKVCDENDQFIGLLVSYRDISENKSMNDELQKRFEAIQDAYKELGLQKRQNDYLQEIATSATNSDSLSTLGQLIISATTMLTKCDSATLRILEDEHLRLIGHLGVSQKWLGRSKIPFKNSLAKKAFKNKRPLIIHNIDKVSQHGSTKLVKEHGFKTCIIIPLFVGENCIGSLSTYATDPTKFRLIEQDFLENLGNQCSIALFTKIQTTA